ncbi:MAG: Ig-like domain repeat protein [Bacilli bacterium]
MPVAKNDRYEFNSWDAELTNETKVEGDTTYTANFKDIKKPTVEIQNVSKYNPKSFDIYATDLESGLKRIDYSLFINDNTDYLGGDGQWIEGSVYEFEQRNITEYYSLEKVKYLFEDLSVGEYTLRVTVSDNEGNTTHATNFNFEVDKITPEFNLTTGYHNDDDIQIIITEKNFSQVKIYNQDTNKTIIEKNLAFTLTEEATYRLTAKDKADNETTIWVAIDKTNPEIYNNDEPIINDSYYKEDVVLNIQDKFLQTVKINGPIEKSLTRSDFEVGKNKENFSYSEILTESGNYEVIAKDKFGNTTTINFVIDKELPSGEVIDIWSNNDINQRYATKGNNVSVRFRTTEEIQEGETNMMIAGIEVENVLKKDSSNPGENVYQGTIVVTKNTPEGLVVFNIEVTDLAGNVGTIPTTVNSGHTVTIDRTNPILEESDIIIDYFNPKTFSFTASDEYGLKTMSYTIWTKGRIKLEQSDGHIYNGVTSKKLTYQINNLSDGEYELRISVFDLAGNYIDASPVYFEVDNTAPIARISSPSEDGKSFGKNVIITGEVDESETNLISHEFEITNPDGTQSFVADMTTNKFNHSFDLDTSKGIGMYTIKYTATDKASNTSSVIRTLNVVDINNPKTTIEVTPISNGNNFTVRGIAEDEEKLNRVYVQLKNRTTGVNCGGTTIHLLDPVQQHAKWSRTYYLPEMKLDSNCYSTGNYAAHVEVVDNLGNRGSAGWTDNFYLDFTNPETTINVSTPVNGKFTVSGVATDNNKLNRVYIQLINRTTGVRCGGTTINLLTSINPKEAEWSREYSSNELKNIEGCSALGNFAAHVSVTDNFGNNSSQGWTDDFLVE